MESKKRVRPSYWRKIEKWKPIQGYDGVYSISNMGRVRRERHWRTDSRGQRRCYRRKFHIPHMRDGKLRVDLKKDGIKTHHELADLMGEHWWRPWAGTKVRLRNPRDIENYSIYNITRRGAKLSEDKREEIRKLKGVVGNVELAKKYKVSRMTIWRIWNGGTDTLKKEERNYCPAKDKQD